jgi:hypothetical protein
MQPTAYRKEQQVGYAIESDLEAGVYRHNTQPPILHPTKYNIMADSESHQEGGDDPISCTFKDVLIDHLVHLLPVSADKHPPHHVPLCIQCGPQEDPGCQTPTHPVPAPMAAQESSLKSAKSLVKNDLQQHLIDNMEGNINNDSEWVITAQPTNNDDQHAPLPHPSQSNTMSDSESPIENREEMFSCTLRNVLKDHFLHLLPVYAGNAPQQYNPLSIQCGSREEHAQQSHIHSVPGPSKSIRGIGSSMSDLHGKVASKGQLAGPTGEGDLAGAIQSPSVLGWVKQHMGTLSHNLVQRVYSKFTTHESRSNITLSRGDGSLHSQDGVIDEHVNLGIELAVPVQLLAKPSIASFPGDASTVQEQYTQWTSDSYRDGHLVSPRAMCQQQKTRTISLSHNNPHKENMRDIPVRLMCTKKSETINSGPNVHQVTSRGWFKHSSQYEQGHMDRGKYFRCRPYHPVTPPPPQTLLP